MIELKTEYPVKLENGKVNIGLIKHWAEDENGNHYKIKQVETDLEYSEAIDIYPSPYTYEITDKLENQEEVIND